MLAISGKTAHNMTLVMCASHVLNNVWSDGLVFFDHSFKHACAKHLNTTLMVDGIKPTKMAEVSLEILDRSLASCREKMMQPLR